MSKAGYHLVVGSKQVSSWSLRPWFLMRQAGLEFAETVITLRTPGTRKLILKHSPSGQVPVLKTGALAIWDSLAIAEYLNERHPEKQLWPADIPARAWARSISAEMHSSFRAMRYALPMEFSSSGLTAKIDDDTRADITRVAEIWTSTRKAFGKGGPFLLGACTIADAMYAPVVSRFTSYGIDLRAFGDDGSAEEYRKHVFSLHAMTEWGKGAKAELAAA